MRYYVLGALGVVIVAAFLLRPGASSPAPTASTTSAVSAGPDAAPSEPNPPGQPPVTIVFESRRGDVTYTHKQHYERVDGKCSVCHPSVFPQSRAPLDYKKANHRAAEASLTSCAFCHAVGGSQVAGKAFASDSYCQRCHVRERYQRNK